MICGSVAGTQETEERRPIIRNLASGLLRRADTDRRVCFQAEDVLITGEGRCTYDRRSVPCTWYGYSFEYELPKREATLECSWSSTDQANVGTPDAEGHTDVSQGHYELKLEGQHGFFFNPQYSVFPSQRKHVGKVVQIRNSCSLEDRVGFEVVFKLRYPER